MVHVKKQKLIQDKSSREYVRWFDRKGRRLYDYADIEHKLNNIQYKVVKQERFWWGGFLSTVWLGLDHSFSIEKDRKPLIFETLLFFNGEPYCLDRYSTLKEARAGHIKAKQELGVKQIITIMLNFVRHSLQKRSL